MSWKTPLVAILVAGAALACTPAPPSGGGVGGGAAQMVGECAPEALWALGDSFTSGVYGIPGWPDQDPPIPAGTFANRGVGGRTIGWLADQLALDLAACGPGDLPDKVVFLAGANDLGLYNLTVAQMQSDLNEIVATATSYGVEVVLIPVLPIPSWSTWKIQDTKRLAYNGWMASTYPERVVDCATPLLDGDGIWMSPSYTYGDATHLNDSGVEVLAGCIYGAV